MINSKITRIAIISKPWFPCHASIGVIPKHGEASRRKVQTDLMTPGHPPGESLSVVMPRMRMMATIQTLSDRPKPICQLGSWSCTSARQFELQKCCLVKNGIPEGAQCGIAPNQSSTNKGSLVAKSVVAPTGDEFQSHQGRRELGPTGACAYRKRNWVLAHN